MAAVTVNSLKTTVQGNMAIKYYNIDIAADADTLDTKLKGIKMVSATSVTNNAIGATVSGSTVTFQTGGAEAGVKVVVHATGK